MSDFPFGMYALMCLYLYCVALPAAVAIQQFWNEDEFCQHLNAKYENNRSVIKVANITCKNIQPKKNDMNTTDNVRFLCREFDSLTYLLTTKSKIDDVKTVVELISLNTMDEMHLIFETNLSYIRLGNLKPNTEYAARFWKLTNGTAYHTMDMPVQKTLVKGLLLGLVHSINISDLTVMNDSTLSTSLTWMPSNDTNCHFRIMYQPDNVKNVIQYRNVDVSESYAVTLNGLIPGQRYTVRIQSEYKIKTIPIRSGFVPFKFSTPPCIYINNFNFDVCPPGQPYDVTVTPVERQSVWGTKGRYDVEIGWKSLNTVGRGMDYFTVKLENDSKNVSGKNYLTVKSDNDGENNVSSAVYTLVFDDVPLVDHYSASVQAFVDGHCSLESIVQEPLLESQSDQQYPLRTVVVLLVFSVFCMAAFCMASLAIGQRVHRRKASAAGVDCGGAVADTNGYDKAVLKALDDVDVLLDDDAVTVSDVFLGRGHFGVVKKGALKTSDGRLCSVAVKSLRDRPSRRDLEEFLREILLMQKVGKHQNIVSMIGCCLDANRRCMLVVEYCQLGDLQTYLGKVSIKSWYANDFYVDRADSAELTAAAAVNSKVVESLQDASGPPPIVFNNCYLYHGEENVFLTVGDLLSFASQVANGMLFLENNRVVHRDLAARNVLLSDHRTIKICDFGLSRDVYEQNLYQKSNRGDPLPVKWMALESLKYQLYTTQSDVWSFGILLWEIMMLGGSPYPMISSSRIYEVLRSGYRMPRPSLCCYSLYEVMLACWHSKPANRPKFRTIKDTIDDIMENQY